VDLQTIGLLMGGFCLLVVGAEVLVRGASSLAIAIGITPLVVGQTVVAYGTSAPELAVSLKSSLAGESDLAIGNILGSNISNILLVLGIAALLRPLVVPRQLVKSSLPLMIGAFVAVYVFGRNGVIDRLEGIGLVATAMIYTAVSITNSRRQTRDVPPILPQPRRKLKFGLLYLVMVAAGITALVLGADWLVLGAVRVARTLGVDELIIGLTIVAVGTSLPEIATSILAGIRGASDIALGNAIGSNIFNVLLVLGACAALAPGGVAVSEVAMAFDIPVMIAVAVACLPLFYSGWRIRRWEGGLLLTTYCVYIGYLFLKISEHPAIDDCRRFLFYVAAPIVGVLLSISAWRSWRLERQAAQPPVQP
jgi:cation:H+ antiporter